MSDCHIVGEKSWQRLLKQSAMLRESRMKYSTGRRSSGILAEHNKSTQQCHTDKPEEEKLFLPSHFPEGRRVQLDLVILGEIERKLHEGSTYDTLCSVQNTVKIVCALSGEKRKKGCGQYLNTQASAKIHEAGAQCDLAMQNYIACQKAMISLGLLENNASFPPLALSDTYQKPTHLHQAVSDSQNSDGKLYRVGYRVGVPAHPKDVSENFLDLPQVV